MPLRYARVGTWHDSQPRTFVAMLPCPLYLHAPLHDETGAEVGRLVKQIRTLPNGRTQARIELAAEALQARPALRDDVLAHRVNLAVDESGRLVLAPPIDTASLPAAPQRQPTWHRHLRVVASNPSCCSLNGPGSSSASRIAPCTHCPVRGA
jgi:hypothetical protein